MKKQEKRSPDISVSTVRLLDFIESKGKLADVAHQIGRSPQLFYNYQKGLSKPSTDVYIDLLNKYPDFDANYILVGKKSVNDTEASRLTREREILFGALEKLGKYKGIAVAQNYDVEGASEMLSNSIFANITNGIFGNTVTRFNMSRQG